MRSIAVVFTASIFAILNLVSRANGAEPLLTKLDLFQQKVGGYASYRIPGIVVTTHGTILAYCEARKDSSSDWAQIDVVLRRSTDGGTSFDAPRKIAHLGLPVPRSPLVVRQKLGKPEDQTVNNPVAIVDRQTGSIHFLYCVEYARCFYMRSDDDGLTFSKPVDITAAFDAQHLAYDWKVIATGPGHGIQLATGRLLVPVWLSTGQKGHHPSIVSVIYSDDHGQSWRVGDVAVAGDSNVVDPNEAEAAQLADGRVMLNVRSESKANRRLIATSPDGISQWSKPSFADALKEPICFGSLLEVWDPAAPSRKSILFANPDNLTRSDGKEVAGRSRDRKNLSVKLSDDQAKTWPFSKVLQPGRAGYCDLAQLPDGTLLCFYERSSDQNNDRSPAARLTVAHFNRAWIERKD